jgi:hypothetical protein
MTNEEVARRIVYAERTRQHEAGHAAAFALSSGVVPIGVSVQQLKHSVGGDTHLDKADCDVSDPERARQAFLAIAAGPAVEKGYLPSWPLLEGESDDEDQLKLLAEIMDLDEAAYEQLEAELWRLIERPDFKRLQRRFVAELESHADDLEADDIERIVAEEKGMAMQPKRRVFPTKFVFDGEMPDDGGEDYEPAPEGMIRIAGRDGEPELIKASAEPWWERDEREIEEFGQSIVDAFGEADASMDKAMSIKIKSFEC